MDFAEFTGARRAGRRRNGDVVQFPSRSQQLPGRVEESGVVAARDALRAARESVKEALDDVARLARTGNPADREALVESIDFAVAELLQAREAL